MTAPISNEPTTHGYTTMRDATGEFFRGRAAGGVVLGELFRGNAAGGPLLGEFFVPIGPAPRSCRRRGARGWLPMGVLQH